MKRFDTIVIGGGFYGLRIAQFLSEELGVKKVLVIEKEKDVMTRASYNNQARVHNGYHYPRSILTALRSRINLPVFAKEYEEALDRSFDKYYAVARQSSKVSARQFSRFLERIGAEAGPAPETMQLFNTRLIEDAFQVKEYAFDAVKLKAIMLRRLDRLGVEIHCGEHARRVSRSGQGLRLETDAGDYQAAHVINTTYSSINLINKASGLKTIPLKHELTEMCLVHVPRELQGKGLTVMCGPFFSLMPFPARDGLYTLSHVRYTPHSEWHDGDAEVRDGHGYLDGIKRISHFPQMYADVRRYLSAAEKITYSGESLWEIKTILPQSEGDDSRPIMYREDYGGLPGYICIMGGKLDNVYDVFGELKDSYDKTK